ncbi:MAG: hypothetical protein V1492_00395 [Candidatus Micrarchaeota archaeon]
MYKTKTKDYSLPGPEGMKIKSTPIAERPLGSGRIRESWIKLADALTAYKARFGEERLKKLKDIFYKDPTFADDIIEKILGKDERILGTRAYNLEALKTIIGYFNQLDDKEMDNMLNKLSLPVIWPSTDGLTTRSKNLAAVIEEERILWFLDELEKRSTIVERQEMRKEEKLARKTEYPLRIQRFLSELETNDKLKDFLFLLPEGETHSMARPNYVYGIIQNTPEAAIRMAYAGQLGATLVELCEMATEIRKDGHRKYKVVKQLPAGYRKMLILLEISKKLRSYWNEELPLEELKEALKERQMEVVEIGDKRAVLKRKANGCTETTFEFKEGIQNKINELENRKMRLRLAMGIVVRNIARTLNETPVPEESQPDSAEPA